MSLTIPVPQHASSSTIKPSTFTPTPQQQAFFSALTDTDRNICLQARAGTGKTTAILGGVDAYLSRYPHHEILVCAYNTSIKDEVAAKLQARGYDWRQVGAQTVHSMGMSLLRYVYRPTVDEKKMWGILDEVRNPEPRTHPLYQFASTILSLVGLGKQMGVGFFDELPIEARDVWHTIADHYDVAGFEYDVDMEAVVTQAIRLYKLSLDITDIIDFNDMILFPLIKGLRVKFTKDLILGDEAQDWSPVRQAIVKMYCKRGTGRIAIVGDDRQAIYAWSGADSQAMVNLTRELDAVTLPLSVTWRCPKAVVELAQKIVPDFEAAPEAPQGEVLIQPSLLARKENPLDLGENPSYIWIDDLTIEDAILCRNNAPLVPLAYRIIRSGIPARVEGRKIGEGLMDLVNRWKVKTTSALRNKILDWRDRETQKLAAKGKETKADEVEDRATTLLEVVTECEKRGRHDVESVIRFIDQLFGDQVKGAVTLSSYHKSKGREWNRVFLLEHSSRCPSRAARQQWQKTQEDNLAYVAMTRTKKTLVFVG